MQPELAGIPETMLWTLHNRASEAARPDGCLEDPKCLEIYQALEYDYERNFGEPDGSHGVRSHIFDERIRAFLAEYPNATIINLGEGLETQRYRIDAPQALWVSVDVPEAIAIRERFIAPDDQHLHIGKSALDTTWFDEVPPHGPYFISAQGLFMYFKEAELAALVGALAMRFPGAILMFDYLNHALSLLSTSAYGWMKTSHYRTPPMPWGIDRSALKPTLSRWIGREVDVHNVTFEFPRGPLRWLIPALEGWAPFWADKMPGACWLQLPPRA